MESNWRWAIYDNGLSNTEYYLCVSFVAGPYAGLLGLATTQFPQLVVAQVLSPNSPPTPLGFGVKVTPHFPYRPLSEVAAD